MEEWTGIRVGFGRKCEGWGSELGAGRHPQAAAPSGGGCPGVKGFQGDHGVGWDGVRASPPPAVSGEHLVCLTVFLPFAGCCSQIWPFVSGGSSRAQIPWGLRTDRRTHCGSRPLKVHEDGVC